GINYVPNKEVPPLPTPVRSEVDEDIILSMRSVNTSIQTIEYRISSMRDRIDKDNLLIQDSISQVSTEIQSLKAEMHMLWDQVAALEQYLREQNKPRKFFFWRR
ncbi:MAG TPA: hypothetical protein O0X99_01970, partial [Methanocorpusculum sp.]|nr:hypothetical protein [Methanocorpusculum sp.]